MLKKVKKKAKTLRQNRAKNMFFFSFNPKAGQIFVSRETFKHDLPQKMCLFLEIKRVLIIPLGQLSDS